LRRTSCAGWRSTRDSPTSVSVERSWSRTPTAGCCARSNRRSSRRRCPSAGTDSRSALIWLCSGSTAGCSSRDCPPISSTTCCCRRVRLRASERRLGRVEAPLSDFPLFPLPIVLLPSEVVPLHIFEDRYQAMVAHCLDERSDFGIVWLADDGLKEIGCTAQIAEVLERAPDGRMNILVRGTRPFRLLERQEDLIYPAGTVELLEDGSEVTDEQAGEQARERYADLLEEITEERPDAGA